MKPADLKAWVNRRYRTGPKRPYGIHQKAADDLAISIITLRHHLYNKAPVGQQTARIIELLDEIDHLKEKCPSQ